MTITRLIFYLLLSVQFTHAQSGPNSLHGHITMPVAVSKAFISRGEAYRHRGGEAPSEEKQRIDRDNHPDRNVIVSLHPLDFTPTVRPLPEAVLLQREKTFVPNVLPVTKGTTVIIKNGDDFFHNVFSLTPGAKFNIGRRPPGHHRQQLIERTGEVKVFCDIHPQMSATILGFDTPYFTRVDAQGHYHLTGLPNGRYRLEVYHPRAGIFRREISLKNGQTGEANVDFNLVHSP